MFTKKVLSIAGPDCSGGTGIKAILGGCTLVQLREKDISSKEFYDTAVRVREVTSRLKVPLIINDRVDIAIAVDADGVHVGQEDIPFISPLSLLC